jgi:hypothetical protein
LTERSIMAHIAIIWSENNVSSCVDKKTSRPTERAQHCGIVFNILYGYHF